MNDNTTRGLLVAGLAANVLFLMLSLLDYSLGGSKNMWPLFVGWAFVIVLMVILSLAGSWPRAVREVYEVHEVRQAPTRMVAPAKPAPAVAPALPAAVPAPQAEAAEPFPFKYEGYTLYSRDVDLKNGGRRTIWFFAKQEPKSGQVAAKPAGYHVGVNERTGLPFLKKGKGADGEDLTPNLVQAYRPQCSALTEEGHQCRNSSRADSKYCISHFGYQPPSIAKAAAKREDTLPRVKGAADTKPSVRKPAA
ncbi:MAG TPA: hypothetical protein VM241_03930 [Candidatus Thermoplasmatota archaeon]|nr:hypothetical protein [Candidatus Thermoplasmatota archaeon]